MRRGCAEAAGGIRRRPCPTGSPTHGADAVEDERDRGLLGHLREKSGELVRSRPEPGLLLLRDLREVHLAATRASVGWTVLGQGAQAVFDAELLSTVTACHPETIRTMQWTVQKLKEAGPQILGS